ncbi:MAG TPA: TIGR03089 family protein [Jatrophihabitantaceae bacterium]|jgi:uncharacterized protein (TIGR03089 family)|nr:TIGR03089 family protein [Jatrophihabitantaceae bacterium]
MTPEQLFGELLAAEPARPFVTYYDEASGERTELSVRSLANWVAKTHFLLIDELGLGTGDAAFVALPAHWISVPAVLGCLTAGLALSTEPAAASVAFVAPSTADLARGVPDVYAVAPSSAAVGFGAAVPDGVSDYVVAVRPQADAWAGVRLVATPSDPGIDARSRAEVVTATQARANELGIGHGTRSLSTRDWSGPSDWIDTLLLPLSVGGSIVYVRNAPDEELVARRMQQERATARI